MERQRDDAEGQADIFSYSSQRWTRALSPRVYPEVKKRILELELRLLQAWNCHRLVHRTHPPAGLSASMDWLTCL